jgi:hypothetical protein
MKRIMGRAMIVILWMSGAFGCSHEKKESSTRGDDGVSYQSLVLPGAIERMKAKETIEPDLSTSLVSGPKNGEPAPAVALMLVNLDREPKPLAVKDGKVEIFVTPSAEVLRSQGCEREGCRMVLAEAMAGFAPNDAHCTVTFIDRRTIITAGHCVNDDSWSNSYVLIDHIRGAHIAAGVARVDADRLARLHCVQSCENNFLGDWAIIDVVPLEGGGEIAAHATLKLADPDAEAVKSIVVQSHMLGLPLLEHETKPVNAHPPRLRFTNHGIGSGAPILQDGKIVGIVRGASTELGRECRGGNGADCEGQLVTWHPRIDEQRRNEAQCRNLKKSDRLCSSIERISP